MKFTGERYVPSEQGQIRLEHVHRYAEAAQLAAGLDVLDVASGEGYGSSLLAERAKSVIGMDIAEDAVRHARRTYMRHPNLRFVQGSATLLGFPDASFDMIASFETIEHLDGNDQKSMLKEMRRVLRPAGFVIVSSPNRVVYDAFGGGNVNQYHLREMNLDEFDELLTSRFPCIRYYAQQLGTGSFVSPLYHVSDGVRIWQDDGVACRQENAFPTLHPYYYIAVCAAEEECLPAINASAFYPNNQDLYLDVQLGASSSYNQLVERTGQLNERTTELERSRADFAELNDRLSRRESDLADREARLAELQSRVDEASSALERSRADFAELNDRLSQRESDLAEREARLAELQARVDEASSALERSRADFAELNDRLSRRESDLAEREARLAELRIRADEASSELERSRADFAELNGRLSRRESELADREARLAESRARADAASSELKRSRADFSELLDRFSLQEAQFWEWIGETTRKLEQSKIHLGELAGRCARQETELAEREARRTEAQARADGLSAELAQSRTDFDELSGRFSRQAGRLAESGGTIRELKQAVKNKEGHIEQLLEVEREYERFRSTRGWKAARMMQKVGDAILPVGSKRRLAVKTCALFARHPVLFARKITFSRISAFFRVLKNEGATEASRRLSHIVLAPAAKGKPIQVVPVEQGEKGSLDAYPKLVFPQCPRPLVSIIIPVYNQFDYTHKCLQSILNNTGDEIAYEIVVGDDCSTDHTRELDAVVHNVRIVRNKTNLQFVRNCNNAAKQAKGKYLLFLNNDTQVQPDWLKPLVELLERDDGIGLAGSKLVYPDGALQEAGGIFWRDGSAWNYGRGQDPAFPDFNYVRETDYVSGAAIMIRKGLWQKLGGFADYLSPAYCEDSDLAFRVRERGYKVVYQPESVVVHFEGVSNGTDVNNGGKAYQVANQRKLYNTWRHVLEAEHFPNGENVFLARGRNSKKRTVLMVDHYVPQYDKDAGSRTVYHYVKLFANMGFHVVFIPDNFNYDESYVKELQQMGVFVLYGLHYSRNWKSWLKENGRHINYAFLNRPHISVKYIDAIRKYTAARIIYYGHDLHYLRELRGYQLTGNGDSLAASEKWKTIELELMRKADVSYMPSSHEVECVRLLDGGIDCRALPMNIFPDVPEIPFTPERRGLLFVGGFGHAPNVDGLKWFASEVMPLLRKKRKDLVLTVVGSNPTDEILRLDGESVTVRGYVDDEELRRLYQTNRMCVAPLRYGAGVKGKVVEAMFHQVPVVTTTVGAEGLDGSEAVLFIGDTPGDFAGKILSAYDDFPLLREKSRLERLFVMENFSVEKAARVIRDGLQLDAVSL